MPDHFRIAFVLAVIYAVAEVILYFVVNLRGAEDALFLRLFVALSIPFGLWIQSKFVRYAGGVWLLVMAGAVAWGIFSSQKFVWSVAAATIVVVGVLTFFAGILMLFSRDFATEFEKRRSEGRRYKVLLRRLLVGALAAAAIVATAFDIYHLSRI